LDSVLELFDDYFEFFLLGPFDDDAIVWNHCKISTRNEISLLPQVFTREVILLRDNPDTRSQLSPRLLIDHTEKMASSPW
jgi:hypothetical protein